MSSAMTPSELQFVRSLRMAMAKAGSNVQLVDKLEPIANPAKKNVGPTVVIEPTAGPWSQNAYWGNTLDMTLENGGYPQAPSGLISVLDVPQFYGPPRARGIELLRSENTNIQAQFNIRAVIRVGIGGISTEWECDWSNVIINLPCSALSISAKFTGTVVTGLYDNTDLGGGPYVGGKLSVRVSNDLIPPTGYPTLTDYLDGTGINSIEAPFNAKGVMLSPSWSLGAALTDQFVASGPGQQSLVWTKSILDNVPQGSVLWLPAGITSFSNSQVGNSCLVSWVL